MQPFTSRTPRDVDALETELAAIGTRRVVAEHGQFREGVCCAATLVAKADATEPWWALAVSSRGESVPPDVVGELVTAAGALTPRQ
jgi:DNA-binding IclR family transcriptional regulator